MLTYKQVIEKAQEILATNPSPELTKRIRETIVKAEKKAMGLYDPIYSRGAGLKKALLWGFGERESDLEVAIKTLASAQRKAGYEEKGGQAKDYEKPSDRATEREVAKVFKRRDAKKAGQPLRDAIAALHTCWRSDGRPHRFEVD